MKKWFLFSAMPLVAFCQDTNEDFFYVNDSSYFEIAFEDDSDFDEALSDEVGNGKEFDQEALSLFSMDLEESDQLPWGKEEFSRGEITSFIEKKAQQMTCDYDDIFAYELPEENGEGYLPTYERVPQRERQYVGRPRVVPSKSEKKENKKGEVAKGNHDK